MQWCSEPGLDGPMQVLLHYTGSNYDHRWRAGLLRSALCLPDFHIQCRGTLAENPLVALLTRYVLTCDVHCSKTNWLL